MRYSTALVISTLSAFVVAAPTTRSSDLQGTVKLTGASSGDLGFIYNDIK